VKELPWILGFTTMMMVLIMSYIVSGEPQGSFPATYVLFGAVCGASWMYAVWTWSKA
jgi:hypothetical protein